MGLTQKILLFTSLLVVALVGISLVFTTAQAESLARGNLEQGLTETRQVWETFQADRYNKLKLGIRVLGNDPFFKSLVETGDAATILDTLKERNEEIKADFFIVADPAGVMVARTDRPGVQGEDLSEATIVRKPLEGEESATVWLSSDRLYHAVSVPMVTGPEIKGVLVAGYGINEALAGQIRNLTHSEIAYLTRGGGAPAQLSVSSLGPREPALRAALGRPELAEIGAAPFEIDLDGDRHVAVQVPLATATGETVGSVVALRSKDAEMAGFRRFRNSLVIVSLVVMAAGLGVAYVAARRITGPVRRLADLVERARNGSYSGKVNVESRDEIGVLARTFNRLLVELREKQQMIDFLREGVTALRKSAAGVTRAAPSGATMAETAVMTSPSPGVAMHRGDLFASRYHILSTLGRGGMGVVYRAHDRQLDEEVALKILRPDVMKDDSTLLERFKQEIKLARRITHRNVLRTHDFGETGGTPYISMEYLEGVTLKDLISNKGALPLGVGLRVARQMCQGLEAAHAQGVVHRDIKPQNMLILPETGDLKIMDFGIARASGVKAGAAGASGLTTAGVVMGTPDYMPPEQAQGATADFRSDVYSLAVVLFEVFTGRLPFVADTAMKVVMAHIQEPPPAPRSVNPSIPPALEGVILRGLDKDPARRYQTVSEMLRDIGDVSGDSESASAA